MFTLNSTNPTGTFIEICNIDAYTPREEPGLKRYCEGQETWHLESHKYLLASQKQKQKPQQKAKTSNTNSNH